MARFFLEAAALALSARALLRSRLVSAAELREFGVFCAALFVLLLLSRLLSRLSAVPPRSRFTEE